MSTNASHFWQVEIEKDTREPTTALSDIEVTLGAYGDVGIGDRMMTLDLEDTKP